MFAGGAAAPSDSSNSVTRSTFKHYFNLKADALVSSLNSINNAQQVIKDASECIVCSLPFTVKQQRQKQILTLNANVNFFFFFKKKYLKYFFFKNIFFSFVDFFFIGFELRLRVRNEMWHKIGEKNGSYSLHSIFNSFNFNFSFFYLF